MTTSHFEETPAAPLPEPPPPPFQPEDQPVHEPAFNAPWQSVALILLIVGGYGIQTLFREQDVINAFAFAPANLAPGHWETAITAIFLHGSWSHALMNGAFALAFATPVARYLGPKLEGGLLFFGFYVLTGVLANLGYAALHPGAVVPIVGASGAVSALMGAAARLIGGRGTPGPMFSKAVLSLGASWIFINMIFAFGGGALLPGAGSAGVAWEAHVIGFILGVPLIGLFGRLAPRD